MRPDAQRDRAFECSAFLFFLDFEPNTCPALLSDAVAKEVAFHAEHGAWDLSLVRESSEWMRDDAFSEVFVGRVLLVILGVKFAERLLIGMQGPSNHRSNCRLDCPAHAEVRVENLWKLSAFLGGLA